MLTNKKSKLYLIRPLMILFLSFLLFFSGSAYSLETGDTAPDIRLPYINQEGHLSIKDLKGTVVYIDFWASWCAPCRKSLPKLNALREIFKSEGFEVYAINLDESVVDARKFLKDIPVNYPVLWDETGKSAELFKISGMPTAYLIDRDGIVRWVHQGFGFGSYEEKAVYKKINKLLGLPQN